MTKSSFNFVKTLGVKYPLIQAPMAGVSTVRLAATIANSGGIGSLPFGSSSSLHNIKKSVESFKELTVNAGCSRNLNLNFFVFHTPELSDGERAINDKWINYFTHFFKKFDVKPPGKLEKIYKSFHEVIDETNPRDDEILRYIAKEARPKVISFHFGIPSRRVIKYLQDHQILVFASATSVDEADYLISGGIDGIVAQGYEAGGHRGNFLSTLSTDTNLSTEELTKELIIYLRTRGLLDRIKVISAGGIMNSSDIQKFIKLGASAVQLGTAFILTPDCTSGKNLFELSQSPQIKTVMTSKVSGKPARMIETDFVHQLIEDNKYEPSPLYPYAYDIFKSLNTAAVRNDNHEYGAYLAGAGVSQITKGDTVEIFSKLVSGFH